MVPQGLIVLLRDRQVLPENKDLRAVRVIPVLLVLQEQIHRWLAPQDRQELKELV